MTLLAPSRTLKGLTRLAVVLAGMGTCGISWAGQQQYEPLAASVQAALHAAVSDRATPRALFSTPQSETHWLDTMEQRLARRIPDTDYRRDLLRSVHYEATRAGLDPQLVLGLIQVESNFRKYAVSTAGARGYMQIMPFWSKLLADSEDNLFHLRTNLRYGCTILRHYLDIENGNLFRALGRYNGSLGKAAYPDLVFKAWQQWAYTPRAESIAASDMSAQ